MDKKIEKIEWRVGGWGDGSKYVDHRDLLAEIDLLVSKVNEIIEIINKGGMRQQHQYDKLANQEEE